MQNLYFALFFIIVGFLLGWWSRSYDIEKAKGAQVARHESTYSQQQKDSQIQNNSRIQNSSHPKEDRGSIHSSASTDEKPEQNQHASTLNSGSQAPEPLEPLIEFKRLVQTQEYNQAISLFRKVEVHGASELPPLRQALLSFLEQYIEEKRADAFSELVNSYLATYYRDIDVLLLLADFNFKSNYFIEAFGVFQIAREYAYTVDEETKVRVALNRFITDVDQYYSKQKSWHMLRQIYEQGEVVDMLNPNQRIRLAHIYAETGDQYSGQTILEDLIATGQAVEQAKLALVEISGGDPNLQAPVPAYETVLDVGRYGNHFIVGLGVPDNTNTMNLMLDTGASITMLTREAFNELSGSLYSRVGTRVFRTAGGIVKGDVYNFSQVQLGPYQLVDVVICVLDSAAREENGVVGLLGMNILGKFHFQINQQEARLLLSRDRTATP